LIRQISVSGYVEKVSPGKIICVGRNYRKHIEEMKSVEAEEPVFFLKPPSSLICEGEDIVIPPQSRYVHHEVELAAVIGKSGKNIPAEDALGFIMGYAILLDITARDLQDIAKKTSSPWAVSKGFDTFAPVSAITQTVLVGDPQDLTIQLWVNDELRQSSNTSYMLHTVAALVSKASQIFTLEPGDIIATGTPEGVGQLVAGDQVRASISHLGTVKFAVR